MYVQWQANPTFGQQPNKIFHLRGSQMDDYSSQKGMTSFFMAATMYEYIKRIGDNIRTQEDKV
jgi:hypothetical protein